MQFKSLGVLILFTVFAIGGTRCKKSPINQLNLLPPATNNGANTFGCLIDGAAMTPKAGYPSLGSNVGPPLYVTFRSQVRITAGQAFDPTHAISMTFYLYDLFSTGEGSYTWDQTQFGLESFQLYNSGLFGVFPDPKTNQYERSGSYKSSGTTFVSKFDLANHIISGTFSGKLAPQQTGGDTVNITNGRFDLKW